MSNTTMNYMGVDLYVEYDYQPAEKEVRYDSDNSGYPGCPASLEITRVCIGDVDVSELFEYYGLIAKMEEEMFEKLY